MIVEQKQLCFGCMQQTAAEKCHYCGYINNQKPESPIFLKPGTVLNNQYLIGKALGQGGFGITYLAWDCHLDIKLAIKEYLPREYATRVGNDNTIVPHTGNAVAEYRYGLDKFLEEAKAVARFQNHPCIVSILNFFKANGTGYIVMPFIDGFTLKDYLLRQPDNRINVNQALNIFMPVLDALREVHSIGMIHRDISPDNIYITQQGLVKLLDFGAARQSLGEHSKSLSIVLKQGYSPEEQYRSKGKQGPWTDIYAVAASFFRSITGEIPPESLDRVAEDDIKSPSELGITIPAHIEQVLMQALAVFAKNRYQTVAEFQQALLESPNSGNDIRADSKDDADSPVFVDPKSNIQTASNQTTATTKTKYQWFFVLTLALLVGGGAGLYQNYYRKHQLEVQEEQRLKAQEEQRLKAQEEQRLKGGPYQLQHNGHVVLDTHTGLQWMRCSMGQTYQNDTCVGEGAKYTYAQAMQLNKSYQGLTGWRLPTRAELQSIVDYSHANPAIDTDYFPATYSGAYWSSSADAYDGDNAWSVYFGIGSVDNYHEDDGRHVRLVRARQ